MPLVLPGGLDDAAKSAGSLLDKGKALLDKGKQIGGALGGLNAIKDDASKVVTTVTDPNTSISQKVNDVADIVSQRAVGQPGQLLPPQNPDAPAEAPQNPDATPPNGARGIISVYVDP